MPILISLPFYAYLEIVYIWGQGVLNIFTKTRNFDVHTDSLNVNHLNAVSVNGHSSLTLDS